ncbi:MAG: SRPBCC family protein [Planctomycetes bacterium]|nr:SRPBCC family protein [Planctomycetota bacterium]
MPIIELHTWIEAPVERVFDLCRSIDAHVATALATGERPVGGVMTGLLALGEQVTWSARHLGWRWQVTSRITAFDRPRHFRDSMVSGVFSRFDHDHEFVPQGGATLVRDIFDFTSPWGPLGRLADALMVTRHMRRFLARRMRDLKEIAESDAWVQYLPAIQQGVAVDDRPRRGARG